MKAIISFLRNKHQDIFRVLLILVSIVLITRQFPQHGSFKYDFEVGKPWSYEDLTAPRSFPIKKSEDQLSTEREQALQDLEPYYEVRPTIPDQVKSRFLDVYPSRLVAFDGDSVFSGSFAQDSARSVDVGLGVIDTIYQQGIIQSIEEDVAWRESDQLNVVTDNEVRNVPRNYYFSLPQSLEEVNELIGESDVPLALRNLLGGTIKQQLEPNVVYDSTTTNDFARDVLSQVSKFRDAVQKDEIIIRSGEIVTQEKYQKLVSLRLHVEGQYGERNRLMVFIGYFLLTGLLLTIFGVFVYRFVHEVFISTRKMLFILVLIVGMIYLVRWAVSAEIPSYYVIPFCIVPIILRTFFGTRLSLYAHLVVVLLASFLVPIGIEYTALNLVAGMVAIFTNIKVHYWSQFFISIGFIFLTYSIGFLGIALIQEGNIMSLEWIDFGWLSINVFFTLLAYPLIPIFERLFGYVSEITLMELGDLNKPLLKQLQLKAPGTFQHSLGVANLAEAAASEIGANSLLVKVGSLYHDVGKMDNPVYFIENQNTKHNPHDELPFDESARIIINHVAKGVEMAKKQRLPEILVDFIRTHHGTSRVEYFYRNYIKDFPEGELDEAKFRYPGPLPYSKETAVVMMADSVEAAARSLKDPTQESLNKLVDGLINRKIEQQQFVNSNITFKEITKIKKVLKKMLHSVYHVRIEYPEEENGTS